MSGKSNSDHTNALPCTSSPDGSLGKKEDSTNETAPPKAKRQKRSMEELKKFREQTPLDVTVTKSIAQLQLGEKK